MSSSFCIYVITNLSFSILYRLGGPTLFSSSIWALMYEYRATPTIAMVVPMPVCVEILLPVRTKTSRVQKLAKFLETVSKLEKTRQINKEREIPKTIIENPITKTRFNTLPTACVRGATLSKVFVATYRRKGIFIKNWIIKGKLTWKFQLHKQERVNKTIGCYKV